MIYEEHGVSLPDRIDVAILGAVQQEVQSLFEILEHSRSLRLVGERFTIGTLRDRTLLIGATGLGKVNAAIISAALLQRFAIGQVWNVGCAGCYPEGPLQVGDVLVSKEILFGDEGILTASGVQTSRGIGIPILSRQEQVFFDSIPAGPLVGRFREKTPPGEYRLMGGTALKAVFSGDGEDSFAPSSFRLTYGPSLCVGMVSGDCEVAGRRFLHYGAFAENMEGSAVAQACFRFDTPFVECRGMSNKAGDRNKLNWQMERAITHCHAVVMHWL